jgi:hypothetical protein
MIVEIFQISQTTLNIVCKMWHLELLIQIQIQTFRNAGSVYNYLIQICNPDSLSSHQCCGPGMFTRIRLFFHPGSEFFRPGYT